MHISSICTHLLYASNFLRFKKKKSCGFSYSVCTLTYTDLFIDASAHVLITSACSPCVLMKNLLADVCWCSVLVLLPPYLKELPQRREGSHWKFGFGSVWVAKFPAFASPTLYFSCDKTRTGLQLKALQMWTKVKEQTHGVASCWCHGATTDQQHGNWGSCVPILRNCSASSPHWRRLFICR